MRQLVTLHPYPRSREWIGNGPGWNTSRPTLSDPLPPVKLDLLEVVWPRPSATSPPAGDQVFQSQSLWRLFHMWTVTGGTTCSLHSGREQSVIGDQAHGEKTKSRTWTNLLVRFHWGLKWHRTNLNESKKKELIAYRTHSPLALLGASWGLQPAHGVTMRRVPTFRY